LDFEPNINATTRTLIKRARRKGTLLAIVIVVLLYLLPMLRFPVLGDLAVFGSLFLFLLVLVCLPLLAVRSSIKSETGPGSPDS
jgi:hypothetical protein